MDLAKVVSTRESYQWNEAASIATGSARGPRPATAPRAAYDYGIKRNILRLLADQGCRVTVCRHDGAEEVVAQRPDGIFLSNGPASRALRLRDSCIATC